MTSQGEHERRRVTWKSDPAQWHKSRRMGRERFVLTYGVLYWGVLTGLLWVAAFGGYTVLVEGEAWDSALDILPFGLTCFPIGGIAFGYSLWWWTERTYRRRMTGQLCLSCKYELRGTIAAGSRTCPECGYEQPREIEPAVSWRRG